jgi:hypothetical protein
VESSCEHGNEPPGTIKCWDCTEWLHKLWPLEWYSAAQSQLVETIQFFEDLVYSTRVYVGTHYGQYGHW